MEEQVMNIKIEQDEGTESDDSPLVSSRDVCIKEEPVSDVEVEQSTELLDLLYADHEVKGELVIGPEVLQQSEGQMSCVQDKAGSETTTKSTDSPVKSDFERKIEYKNKRFVENKQSSVKNLLNSKNGKSIEKKTKNKKRSKAIICDICNKVFTTKFNLTVHIKVHNGLKSLFESNNMKHGGEILPFACDTCDKCFSRKADLELHMWTHTGEKPLASDIITTNKLFIQKRASKRCTINHTKKKSIRGIEKKHVTELLDHEIKEQMVTKPVVLQKPKGQTSSVQNNDGFKTDIIRRYFSGKEEFMKKNIKNQTFSKKKLHDKNLLNSESKVKSDNCKESFDKRNKAHLLKRTVSKTCDICYKVFCTQFNLRVHMTIHTGEKPFACNICNRSFRLKVLLKCHMMKTHTGERPFTCDICNKKFIQKYALKDHMITHTREKPFICHICDKSFTRKRHLKQHMMIHTGRKHFACDICDKRFNRKHILERHMITHTGQIPFTCHVCGKGLSRKGHLQRHMIIHTAEKPFACDICSKRFREKSSLKSHMVTHYADKAFVCEICDRGFKLKIALRRHILTHPGVKSFACKICDKHFTLYSTFKGHVNEHARERPFVCDICNKGFNEKLTLKKHVMVTHF